MDRQYGLKQIEEKAREMEVDISWAIERKKTYTRQVLNGLNAEVDKDVAFISECKSALDRTLTIQRIDRQKKEIDGMQKYLSYLDNPNTGEISDYDIGQAKMYPIEKLLPNPIKNNMTRCPFHEDKNPSMSIKNNKVRCFACNQTWDTIAVVMELQGINFVNAVKFLREK